MKYSLLPVLLIALHLGACSSDDDDSPSDEQVAGSETGTDTIDDASAPDDTTDDSTTPDETTDDTSTADDTVDDPFSLGETVADAQLINGSQIGPEPNFWDCSLTRNDADTQLNEQYQFFNDNTGVVFAGTSSVTYSWNLLPDTSGRLDIDNDSGAIPNERWFVDFVSPTTFTANIAFADSEDERDNATFADTDARLQCVLTVVDDGPVNPNDTLTLQDDQIDNGLAPGEIAPVAQAIINTGSSFGLENELWSCITDDGQLDLLLGFYANGIGGTYTTQNGTLEREQSSYVVVDNEDTAFVVVDAVFNNEADQLELLDVVFERPFQFTTRLRSTALEVDTTAICETTLLLDLNI